MATREVDDDEVRAARLVGRKAYDAGSDFLFARLIADGRMIAGYPIFGGGVRVGIGLRESCSFADVWDYPVEVVDAGWRALLGWDGDGEPEGWYRHPASGRRRPDGDPAKEHVHE
jgi:hypothetical protein